MPAHAGGAARAGADVRKPPKEETAGGVGEVARQQGAPHGEGARSSAATREEKKRAVKLASRTYSTC
jgi:hypothetical protein